MKNQSIIYADLNEIIHAHRGQSYGAYQIRSREGSTTMLSFYIAASAMAALVMLLYFNRPVSHAEPLPNADFVITEVPISPLVDAPKEPEEPKEAKAAPVVEDKKEEPAKADPVEEKEPVGKAAPTVDDRPIKPADTEEDNSRADKSEVENKHSGDQDTDSDGKVPGGDPDGPADGKGKVPGKPDGGEEPGQEFPSEFEPHLGEMPVALNMDDIRRKVGYPSMAREMSLEGKVTLRVLVDDQGNYVRHVVLRSSNHLFLQECEKHIREVKFQPGRMGDINVPVWVVIPFTFKLAK